MAKVHPVRATTVEVGKLADMALLGEDPDRSLFRFGTQEGTEKLLLAQPKGLALARAWLLPLLLLAIGGFLRRWR